MGRKEAFRSKNGSSLCSTVGILKGQASSLVLFAQEFTDVQAHSEMLIS